MTYTAWLRSLGRDALAELLRLRPDAADRPAPANLEELVKRLTTPHSIRTALADVDAVALQLAEVFAGLGPLPRSRIADWYGDAEPIRAGIRTLIRRGLIWETTEERDGTLRSAGPLQAGWPQPLNLGQSLKQLLSQQLPDVLDLVLQTLQLATRARSPQYARQLISGHLTAERIVKEAAQAPPAVAKVLDAAAWDAPTIVLEPYEVSWLHWIGSFRRDTSGIGWAVARALLLPVGYQTVHMPREVALALRGPDWRPSVFTERLPVLTTAVEIADVNRECAAAAAASLALVTSVLEALAVTPATVLRTGAGGVGVREVRRLAKATGREERDVILALETLHAAGLLTVADAVLPTDRYDEWRSLAPAERLVEVIQAWWTIDGPVTNRANPTDDKPWPALGRYLAMPEVTRLRQDLVRRAALLPAGTGISDISALLEDVRWDRPLAYPTWEIAAQAEAVWWEAAAFGLVAHDAVTSLGHAVVGGDRAVLTAAAATLLPAATSEATFQADLTAMVRGTPDAGLADLLDSAADREARSSASVWRFSPRSVRRYFDAGGTADDLLTALSAISKQVLPQPLEYLVGDVARRHGTVSVRPVNCCVLSADEPLLAEIAAHRALRPLDLQVLAPTVLASNKPVSQTIDALRSAGYAPVQHTTSGTVVVRRPSKQRASQLATGIRRPGQRHQPAPIRRQDTPSRARNYRKLAEQLLDRPDEPTSAAEVESLTLRQLTGTATTLPGAELRVLSHAIDKQQPVHIEYVDQNGKRTSRVISQIMLHGTTIEAWCHLRQAERWFSLSGIKSVSPAP